MKKLLALLLATLMVFALAACGKGNADGDDKKDYSKLSTTDKITYILGKISDEPETEGQYINELIGIRITLDSKDDYNYDIDYPTRLMKETDYTKEYLSTIESQESITVFSAKDTYNTMTIELKKMPQNEIDEINLETYVEERKGEDATIHRGKVAGIPVYYTSEDSRHFFVIKCEGYLAEFRTDGFGSTIRPIETAIKDVGVKDSKLHQLYNAYQEIEQMGEITGKEYAFFSEKDDKGNEIKKVYGTIKNLSDETMVMYNPDNNTISILSVDAGFYDGYSFEDGIIVEFNEDNKPVKSVEIENVGEENEATVTKTYSYDANGRIIEINEKGEYKQYPSWADPTWERTLRTFEYVENSNNFYIFGALYEFDDNGVLISSESDYGTYYYEYDENGNAIKQYTKDSSGEIERIVREYEYDEYGALTYVHLR